MTPDQQHPHEAGPVAARAPGLARRTAVAAAWSTPVIAAAVAAPGASASPVASERFTGVSVGSGVGGGRFSVFVFLTMTATAITTDVVFKEDVRVDIIAEHDVASWGAGVVADGPRAAHLVIPAGSHPLTNEYETEGGLAAVFLTSCACRFTASPTGGFTVSAAVTQGPLYRGSDPIVRGFYGSPSAKATVTI